MDFLAKAAIAISLSVLGATVQAQPVAQRPGDGPPTARLDRLEAQIAELQSVVSAVESLARSQGGRSTGYAAATGPSSEQMRQLSEQIADLTQRLERLEARLGPASQGAPQREAGSYAPLPTTPGFENKEPLPPLTAPPPAVPSRPAPPPPVDRSAAAAAPAPLAAPSGGGGAKALFDHGTAALNQREYTAAETYFQQFLDEHPSDALAPAAQYWLGETAFVSGEYRVAADRFLKTFTAYPSSERAPEALLKLAISLRRLGQNNAACDSFAELARRFPQAQKSIQQRADTEKKRANCS